MGIPIDKPQIFITRACDRNGYVIYIYRENEKGEISYAKPIKLEFGEFQYPGLICEPAMFIPYMDWNKSMEGMGDAEMKRMLSQKDSDKNDHIQNLNEIIKELLKK